MKILGLTVGLIVLMASCQKENLRPAANPATQYNMLKCGAPQPTGRTTSVEGRGTDGSDGIVDPNADQDASGSSNKGFRKGGK